MSARTDTVVFVHAHPDDEAIFTGGTMRRLATAGHRVILVVATGGELGLVPPGSLGAGPLTGGRATAPPVAMTEAVAAHRTSETDRAAALLGIDRVVWLGYHDSGMAGDPANNDPASFWVADVDDAASRLAEVLVEESATAVVVYDGFGIYGHPDHVQVHRVGLRAADLADVPTRYESTVDREYLHFVETHLVEEAILAGDLGLVRSHIGLSSIEIDLVVDVRPVLGVKRAAMAAHASQIPETTSALQLPDNHFTEVYGWEWYVHQGAPGPIEHL